MTLALLHFLAIIYLTIGMAMSLNPGSVKAGVDNFLKSTGMMFVAGLISLMIGAALVTWHNQWDGLNEIIVSLVGWMALLKGFMYLAFPKDIKALAGKMYKTDTCIRVWGMIVLLVGALLMALAKGML